MARRSILASVREERNTPPPEAPSKTKEGVRASRVSKLHIGGYFEPDDATVIAFQKLRIDLRRSQQDMLLEALRDFVAKHEAANAFR